MGWQEASGTSAWQPVLSSDLSGRYLNGYDLRLMAHFLGKLSSRRRSSWGNLSHTRHKASRTPVFLVNDFTHHVLSSRRCSHTSGGACQSLLSLRLVGCHIGTDGAAIIASILPTMRVLKDLNLSYNPLGNIITLYLIISLRSHMWIHRLDHNHALCHRSILSCIGGLGFTSHNMDFA